MSSFDIIVPCYNYARYLTCCVESILNQEGVDVRILIIDDASSDDTERVGRALAVGDRRIRFRRHPANEGNIRTYNEGIEWARADYFLIISADDWLLPGSLARVAKVFKTHPEVAFLHGIAAVATGTDIRPSLPSQPETLDYAVVTGQSFIEAACSDSAKNPVWTPTAVVRTSLQKSMGKYCAELPHAGDLHLWLRLACHGSIAKINAFQAVYRKHDSNMHRSYCKLKNLRQHLLAFESVFAEYADQISNREALQLKYRRNLALSAIQLAQYELMSKDRTACGEYVGFAQDVYPNVTRSLAWGKMRVLQAIGHRAAYALKSVLTPAVRAMRRRPHLFRPPRWGGE
jgi:glycosyltransferase involved in cell wall biosynthesis